MPAMENEPSPWSVTMTRGSRRTMSSMERLPLGVDSSSRCDTLVDRPLLAAENVRASALAETVTADNCCALVSDDFMIRLIALLLPNGRQTFPRSPGFSPALAAVISYGPPTRRPRAL